MLSDEKIYVEYTVSIGGDLPKNKLESFINAAMKLYHEDPYEFTYKRSYMNNKRQEIREAIAGAQVMDQPVILKALALNGEINLDFKMFCVFNGLRANINLAPHIDKNGNYHNNVLEMIGTNLPVASVIPLDGCNLPTTLVDDVFAELDRIFDELETPITSAPKKMNEDSIAGDIARRRLRGEALRKILTDVLKSRIDYPDTTLPPFHIL